MNISLSPFAPENLVSPDGFGRPVPRQPAHLRTQAESVIIAMNNSSCFFSGFAQVQVAYPDRGQLVS